MDLRRLRYFLRVASDGSLSRASRTLGIAQPALGRQMQLLEADLGVQLFERSAKGMHLTDEGEYLREAVAHHVQQIELALQSVGDLSTRVEATCRLGLPPGIAGLLGPGLVTKLKVQMPNLSLVVIEDESWRLAAELLRGTVDIAILAGVSPDERLFHTELLTEPLLLVGAVQSRLAGRAAVRFDELSLFPLVVPPPPHPLLNQLEKLAARDQVKLAVAHQIAAPDVTKAMLRSASVYSIMSPVSVKPELDRGELIGIPIVDPELRQSVFGASQRHWRIPRSTYNQFHQIFYAEWADLVASGEWPATWLVQPSEIARRTA